MHSDVVYTESIIKNRLLSAELWDNVYLLAKRNY